MNRAIVAFHADDHGDWIAELSCLHNQHVRHSPPFRWAPWVVEESERAARVGTDLDCPLCDRTELPEGLRIVRTTDVWDEGSAPAALRRAHRVAKGTWGRIQVEHGQLRFHALTEPPLDVVVVTSQPIPPEVEHHVELSGAVRFSVEFLRR